MGVQISEILVKRELELEKLRGKVIAIDAPNHLYQFLSTIRQRDGSLFADSGGSVTSHLIGLLSRTTSLLRAGVKLVYVFDGEVPELKRAEISRRAEAKGEAAEKLAKAEKAGDVEAMKKYAARTSRLTPEMIGDAKELLSALGVPWLVAPSEGEAQAAHMAKKGSCYAVASQDADCLLFQSPILIRNLSITGRRKLPGRLGYQNVFPELISLEENLKHLGIDQEQLIAMAMLVGTDYNSSGIKGIGPKKALKLVREQKSLGKIFEASGWDSQFTVPWQEIYDTITKMPVSDDYDFSFKKPDRAATMRLLVDGHGFSHERVEKAIAELCEADSERKQRGLMDFA